MFGTSIYTDFTLIPLLKGLTIGRILIELIEAQELSFEAPRENKRRKLSRTVAEDTSQLSDNAEAEEIEGEEGYRFTRAIAIPKSLRKCVQTVEAKGIKIKHSLAFNVQLHNPDGHLSEVSTFAMDLVEFMLTHKEASCHLASTHLYISKSPSG